MAFTFFQANGWDRGGRFLSRSWGNQGVGYWRDGEKQLAYENWLVAYHLNYWPNDQSGYNRAIHLRNLAIAEFHQKGCHTFKRLQQAVEAYPGFEVKVRESMKKWYEKYPEKFHKCKDEVLAWETQTGSN